MMSPFFMGVSRDMIREKGLFKIRRTMFDRLFTNDELRSVFQDLRENSLVFDDIQFNADCVNQQLHKLLRDGDENISSTAYHMAKILKLLEYWNITK